MLTWLQSGFLATTICFAMAVILVLSLRFVMMRENERREKTSSGQIVTEDNDNLALTDQTDKENLKFRYLL